VKCGEMPPLDGCHTVLGGARTGVSGVGLRQGGCRACVCRSAGADLAAHAAAGHAGAAGRSFGVRGCGVEAWGCSLRCGTNVDTPPQHTAAPPEQGVCDMVGERRSQ
jgi:hypothetical protein